MLPIVVSTEKHRPPPGLCPFICLTTGGDAGVVVPLAQRWCVPIVYLAAYDVSLTKEFASCPEERASCSLRLLVLDEKGVAGGESTPVGKP